MVANVGEVGSSGVFDGSVKNDALTVVRRGDSLTFTFVSKDRSEKAFYEAIAAEYRTTPEAVKWACTSPNSENKKELSAAQKAWTSGAKTAILRANLPALHIPETDRAAKTPPVPTGSKPSTAASQKGLKSPGAKNASPPDDTATIKRDLDANSRFQEMKRRVSPNVAEQFQIREKYRDYMLNSTEENFNTFWKATTDAVAAQGSHPAHTDVEVDISRPIREQVAPFAKLDPAKVRRFGELTPRIDNTGAPYAYQVKVGALARNEAGFCAFMQEAYGCTSAQAFLFDNYLKEWMAGEVEFPAENTADPRRVFDMNDGVFMQRRGDQCTFFVQPDPSKPAKVFTSTKEYIAPDWEAATATLWVSSFNNGIEQAVGIREDGRRMTIESKNENSFEVFDAAHKSRGTFKNIDEAKAAAFGDKLADIKTRRLLGIGPDVPATQMHEQAKGVQRALKAQGYPCPVDGNFGDSTLKALRTYKEKHQNLKDATLTAVAKHVVAQNDYTQGLKAFEAKNYSKAEALFDKSFEISGSANALYMKARCEASLGHKEKAIELLSEARKYAILQDKKDTVIHIDEHLAELTK